MIFIEDCTHPIIGNYYWVRCVLVKGIWRPVFAESHSDNPKHALPHEHYHQDWRFVKEEYIIAQRRVFDKKEYDYFLPQKNREYFAPIMKSDIEEERYRYMQYLRHFEIFSYKFGSLEQDMKRSRMKNFVCPHHKTNLKSCVVINGVIQCPQHGLRWDIKSGELVTN